MFSYILLFQVLWCVFLYMFKPEQCESQTGVDVYFDLGNNKENSKQINKENHEINVVNFFFTSFGEHAECFKHLKKPQKTDKQQLLHCWNKMIKLHLEFKRSVACWQQQHKAFSTSPPEASYFSLPAYNFYVVTAHILHQTQKLCHLFCSGWVSAAGADDWLSQSACVAPQISRLCKGHTRRSCKVFWSFHPLVWELQFGLGPKLLQLHLCTLLSLPWWHDFPAWLGPDWLLQLVLQSQVCQLNLVTAFAHTFQCWLVWNTLL